MSSEMFITHLDSKGMGSSWCHNKFSRFNKRQMSSMRVAQEWTGKGSKERYLRSLISSEWWDVAPPLEGICSALPLPSAVDCPKLELAGESVQLLHLADQVQNLENEKTILLSMLSFMTTMLIVSIVLMLWLFGPFIWRRCFHSRLARK